MRLLPAIACFWLQWRPVEADEGDDTFCFEDRLYKVKDDKVKWQEKKDKLDKEKCMLLCVAGQSPRELSLRPVPVQ